LILGKRGQRRGNPRPKEAAAIRVVSDLAEKDREKEGWLSTRERSCHRGSLAHGRGPSQIKKGKGEGTQAQRVSNSESGGGEKAEDSKKQKGDTRESNPLYMEMTSGWGET